MGKLNVGNNLNFHICNLAKKFKNHKRNIEIVIACVFCCVRDLFWKSWLRDEPLRYCRGACRWHGWCCRGRQSAPSSQSAVLEQSRSPTVEGSCAKKQMWPGDFLRATDQGRGFGWRAEKSARWTEAHYLLWVPLNIIWKNSCRLAVFIRVFGDESGSRTHWPRTQRINFFFVCLLPPFGQNSDCEKSFLYRQLDPVGPETGKKNTNPGSIFFAQNLRWNRKKKKPS